VIASPAEAPVDFGGVTVTGQIVVRGVIAIGFILRWQGNSGALAGVDSEGLPISGTGF